MAIPGRQYGLTLPKKAQQLHPVLQKPSVFGNDSDDDDETIYLSSTETVLVFLLSSGARTMPVMTSVSESLQREAAKKQAMKQTKLEIQKALAEDSTVYEYDSIYDEMKKKKEESNPKLLLGKDRKPKYIHNLLKAVEIRKKEQEKRMEKKIQREREMEKGEFDDKEAFVTSAYKKKLQERAEEEERERRAAALEAHLDVTKQSDLSGFYRHLLNQAVGEEEVPTCSFREARSGIKEEKSKGYSDEVSSENRTTHENCIRQTVVKVEENPDADSDFDAKSSEDDETEEDNRVNCRREKGTETLKNDSRHHRSHTHSRSSSEEREHGTKYHTKVSKSRGHEKREDQHQERQSTEDSYYADRDYQKEKKDSHRHREASYRDSHWKRHEQEDRLRGRDQRERNDREWKREKDREKYPSREQERDRQRNDYDRHIEKGGEKEEKSKEKEEHMKARKERYENSDKYREREKREVTVQSSERNQERKESSPNSRAKDRFLNQERASKMRNMEKDKERNPEKPSSSETSLGAKHRIREECQGTGKEQERPHETVNKFAKRSNEETVMSARDRYLARQMARVNAKTYIEKEDD